MSLGRKFADAIAVAPGRVGRLAIDAPIKHPLDVLNPTL